MPSRVLHALLLHAAMLLPVSASAQEPQTTFINRDASVYSDISHSLYLVDTSHDAIAVISSSNPATSIPVGSHPIALALNRRTGLLYAVNSSGRSVSIIDTRSNSVVATAPTAARPYAIAVDEAANKIYVSNTFSNILTVIDGATHTTSNLRVGSFDAILIDSDRHRIDLLGYESDALTVLDPATGATTKLPAGAMHLWGLARAGKTLYVSHVQDAEIAAIDLETHAIRTLATGKMPCAIAVSASTGEIYVANYADATVTVISPSGSASALHVAPHPQALTLDDAAGLLYIASPQNNAVTVIDTKHHRMPHIVNDLDHPLAVAVDPATHAAYAASPSRRSTTPRRIDLFKKEDGLPRGPQPKNMASTDNVASAEQRLTSPAVPKLHPNLQRFAPRIPRKGLF